MGQADWAELGSSLLTADVARGVTNGIARPNGGGSFVWGWNTLDSTVTGAHGLYVNLTGFTPTGSGPTIPDGGTSMRGAVRRVASPGNTGFSPFLFACAQGGPPSVNDEGYLLGLSDADPYRIMLVKGAILGGINPNYTASQILGQSSAQYSMGDALWHHLRLDAVVEPNGDVLLKVFHNDLVVHALDVPGSYDWQSVPGFDAAGIVDDVLQIASGTPPLWGGYCGFAFSCAASLNRRAAVDGLQAYRVT